MPKKTRKPIKTRQLHWFKKIILYSLIYVGFITFSYIGYLDYTVREKFDGNRWSMPAKIYASPVEIYSGLKMTSKEFEDFLHSLHYSRNSTLNVKGAYYKTGQSINIHTRSFRFWDTQQKNRKIKIKFSPKAITKILDLTTLQEIPILRMEPIQIGSFYPTRKEDRILIKLENAPKLLIKGLLAIEDHDFYQHIGLSFKAIARAVWANMLAGTVVQGGSTITQQLVKNFYLSSEKSYLRKINEALMAIILELRYQKEAILEAYLNEIYLGQDDASAIHGFGLASEFYFARSLKNLQLHEIATLVALVRGPSLYNPRKRPDKVINRRNLVLDKMFQLNYTTKKQTSIAKKHKLRVVLLAHHAVNRYPDFLDLVKRRLKREYREQDLTSDGLRIFTTINTHIQSTLEKTLKQKLNQLDRTYKSKNLQTTTIITRRENGEIVALAGGRSPYNTGFNRALDAVRPIGSLIKPVVYLTALEYPQKYTISTIIKDTAITVTDKQGKIWQPKNYDKKAHGDVELRSALIHSYNLATVRIGMQIGLARIAKTLKNLGVNRPISLFPSLLLGALPLTPLEVTQIYQTLAGDGFATPLRSILGVITADGERLQSYRYAVRQTVNPEATYITNKILQDAMKIGTGRSAYLHLAKELDLVGKTGTSNKLRDSWFAGYSGDYLSVVWVGRDDNKPSGLTGASGALQIWIALMKKLSIQPVNLIPPDDIERRWVDPSNGLLADKNCKGAVVYPYIKNSAPRQNSPCVSSNTNKSYSWFKHLF